jgi:putative membrane protein
MIEQLFASLFGIVIGIFTGITPGIHINLVAAALLSNIDNFDSFDPLSLALFIVSLSITHTFIDFIPSILLGAPNEETALSILPGHRLLKQGRSFEAIVQTQYGCIIGIIVSIIIAPLFIIFLPQIFTSLKNFIPFILILISIYIILRDKHPEISFLIFSASGILGLLVFNSPIEIKEPLLPLLTGLFGISSLITSIKESPNINKQIIRPLLLVTPNRKEIFSCLLSTFISSPLGSIFPGIGSGHAAVIGSELSKKTERTFLLMLGAINSSVMILSIVTAYSIGKTRTGSAAAIKTLLVEISKFDLLIIFIIVILISPILIIVSLNLTKIFIKSIQKINYKILNILVLIFVIIVNIILTNWTGIILLILSSILGLSAVNSQTRRINLMACLILPSIIYYLIN